MKYKLYSLVLTCSIFAGSIVGCTGQKTASQLIAILGQQVAVLATFEGKSPDLVAKIKTDSLAVSTAIENWKEGTPANYILQGLNLLEDDLYLFPVNPQDQFLIDLSISTVESIVVLFPKNTPITGRVVIENSDRIALRSQRPILILTPPKNAKEFREIWNSHAKVFGKPTIK